MLLCEKDLDTAKYFYIMKTNEALCKTTTTNENIFEKNHNMAPERYLGVESHLRLIYLAI